MSFKRWTHAKGVAMCLKKLFLIMVSCLCVSCHSNREAVVRPVLESNPEEFKVIGFFGGGQYRYAHMTHFIPGFLGFDGDGNLAHWDLRDVVVQAHANQVKVIVSFDGEHWRENFLPMSDNADGSRDRFISNLTQFLVEQDIDGVDYDWEIGGGFSPECQKQYSDLVIATKESLHPLNKTVSIDVYFRDELNTQGLAAVDWIQLMSYQDLDEMHAMIDYWRSKGVPPEKMVVGMAVGWGDANEGFDHDLVASKTEYAIKKDFAGVMLFRTDLDTTSRDSMLHVVSDVIKHTDAQEVANN